MVHLDRVNEQASAVDDPLELEQKTDQYKAGDNVQISVSGNESHLETIKQNEYYSIRIYPTAEGPDSSNYVYWRMLQAGPRGDSNTRTHNVTMVDYDITIEVVPFGKATVWDNTWNFHKLSDTSKYHGSVLGGFSYDGTFQGSVNIEDIVKPTVDINFPIGTKINVDTTGNYICTFHGLKFDVPVESLWDPQFLLPYQCAIAPIYDSESDPIPVILNSLYHMLSIYEINIRATDETTTATRIMYLYAELNSAAELFESNNFNEIEYDQDAATGDWMTVSSDNDEDTAVVVYVKESDQNDNWKFYKRVELDDEHKASFERPSGEINVVTGGGIEEVEINKGENVSEFSASASREDTIAWWDSEKNKLCVPWGCGLKIQNGKLQVYTDAENYFEEWSFVNSSDSSEMFVLSFVGLSSLTDIITIEDNVSLNLDINKSSEYVESLSANSSSDEQYMPATQDPVTGYNFTPTVNDDDGYNDVSF